MNVWRLPRESVEWVGPVTMVGDSGELELALVLARSRPTESDWKAPMVLDGELGYLVEGLEPGSYRLWARVKDAPETAVFDDVAVVQIT